jgi:hypothetical protein
MQENRGEVWMQIFAKGNTSSATRTASESLEEYAERAQDLAVDLLTSVFLVSKINLWLVIVDFTNCTALSRLSGSLFKAANDVSLS